MRISDLDEKRYATGGESYYSGDGLNKALITPQQIKDILKSQRMKTNGMLIIIFLSIFLCCKGNGIKDKSEEGEKNRLSIDEKTVSFSRESPGKGAINTQLSFVVSCGSGCSMRYSAENIIYDQSDIEVKFKIEAFIDGNSNDISYETYIFSYDSSNEVVLVRQKGNTENILENLTSDARLSFKAFGKKIHEKSPEVISNKRFFVESNDTLPYSKRIDVKTVKYSLMENKFLKGSSKFLCDGEGELRYLPLPNKGSIYLILVPMDCGDFEYQFYLLTIKNQTVISNLYVEGIWYEPDNPKTKEITSFEIDKDFSIKVKTTSLGSPQQVRQFTIRSDGQIIEK